jgi:alkylhydroperoxidase family enzyme
MADIRRAKAALIERILRGSGTASRDDRRSAFDGAVAAKPLSTLVEKVVRRAYEVTDEDVAAARDAGLSEDQIFEIVVCAAVGEANRQHEAALSALDAAAAGV